MVPSDRTKEMVFKYLDSAFSVVKISEHGYYILCFNADKPYVVVNHGVTLISVNGSDISLISTLFDIALSTTLTLFREYLSNRYDILKNYKIHGTNSLMDYLPQQYEYN